MRNENIKSKKKDKKREKKVGKKKEKRAQKGCTYHPRWVQNLIFHIRTVKRNRHEIEAQKKSDFEHPTKTKNMKEHERT